VKRLAALFLALTGCYLAPINQRPSVSIHNLTDGTIVRGQTVDLEAITSDPDNDLVLVNWRAYACTSGVDPTPDCDEAVISTGSIDTYSFAVPATRADGTTPTRAVRVILDAHDDRGALARPEQELVIAIGDAAPVLALRKASLHDFVVGSHVSLFADVTDPDDGPDQVTLDWTVFSPATQPQFDLIDEQAPTAAAGHRGEAKSLVPDGIGDWDVQVVATDELGSASTADFDLVIGPDEPPCIASEEPIASGSDTLPLFEATEFTVPVVTDDLDSYPPVLGDIDDGAASFAWTLQTNGGAREPLAVSGNTVELDPASYHPGDTLELRVEVDDRQDRGSNFSACGDTPTCAINAAQPTCTQRQTWHMEIQ
jgi:hypothetical protein